jgi:hypothetical protein
MIFQSSKVNFQWSMETFKMVSGIPRSTRARSLAWLERPADNREAMSSNLIGPTISFWLTSFFPRLGEKGFTGRTA